ncbi:MAG: serine protease [Bdellovibrio sp.]|nr:MAG: serine protease [Bdellovibrio sp.]
MPTTPARAERFFVLIKDRDTFSHLDSQFKLSESLKMSEVEFVTEKGQRRRPFSDYPLHVQDSLTHLQSIVIDARTEALVSGLKNLAVVGGVEREQFHPLPEPVGGFQSFEAWNMGLKMGLKDVVMEVPDSVGGDAATGDHAPTQPGMPWGIAAIRAPEAWSVHGQGEGARALVLDTGLDVQHPAIAPNFERGLNFLEGGEPEDLTDLVGHGTHVSGTIAGKMLMGGFVGVAPKAKILMGKVCATRGCSNIAVAQGINWGITQKVDVINMSLGGPQGTFAEKSAVEAADNAGIVVVAASGNAGVNKVDFPAAFAPSIAVGAVDVDGVRAKFSQYGPELAIVGPGVSVLSSVPVGSALQTFVTITSSRHHEELIRSAPVRGGPLVPTSLTNTLVDCGLGMVDDMNKEVKGHFALIGRGSVPFPEKIKNAVAAGAAGVLLYNNEPGLVYAKVTMDNSTVAIPVMMVEESEGLLLKEDLGKGRSPTAAVQTTVSDYANFSGTSMATPHVSGVVALVRSVRHDLNGTQVKQLLKSTARPLGDSLEYGAGFVNAEGAVKEMPR